MILDEKNEFGDSLSVALTAGAAWQNVGDLIDLGSTNTLVDIGNGQPVWLIVRVASGGGITAAGAGTFAMRLVSDATTTIHASTSTVHVTSATITTQATTPATGLTAGSTIIATALPLGSYERYIAMQAQVVTQSTSAITDYACTVDAFLTTDPAKYVNYADNSSLGAV